LLAHPEQAKRYREEARNRIREVYSWEKVVTDLEKLYDGVKGIPE